MLYPANAKLKAKSKQNAFERSCSTGMACPEKTCKTLKCRDPELNTFLLSHPAFDPDKDNYEEAKQL